MTATLSVTPAGGAYQTQLAFTGSGYAPNEKVKIYSSGVGSAVLAGAAANSNGAFTASAKAPASPYGPRIFLGAGQGSGLLGAAGFSVTARLIVKPASGEVGSTATAEGFGFGAGETVDVYWSNPNTLLGTATADTQGSFRGGAALTFTIPDGAPRGRNQVYGVGQTTGAMVSVSFTVK